MRVIVDKQLIPQLNTKIGTLKTMEAYKFDGYEQDETVLVSPSNDLPLDLAMEIGRLGAVIENYEYWIEVPDTELANDVPAGMSFSTYLNDDPVPIEVNRKWNELGELAASFVPGHTLRYWQPSSDGAFLFNDVEILQESGFEVFGHASLQIKLNEDYSDTGDPEYVVQETIEYIDLNWGFAGYFDMVHAHIRMTELYEAKGIDDNARWAASTDAEKEVLVRWNIVGLNKAASIMDPGWTEARQVKELGKMYREFNLNMVIALEKRFTDWYQYLNMVLTNAGNTKFHGASFEAGDWNWNLKEAYVHQFLRQYELGDTNALVDFNQTTLTTYVDADFFGTIPAATIVANLEKVLNAKTYPI
jgi:hypothetical protein